MLCDLLSCLLRCGFMTVSRRPIVGHRCLTMGKVRPCGEVRHWRRATRFWQLWGGSWRRTGTAYSTIQFGYTINWTSPARLKCPSRDGLSCVLRHAALHRCTSPVGLRGMPSTVDSIRCDGTSVDLAPGMTQVQIVTSTGHLWLGVISPSKSPVGVDTMSAQCPSTALLVLVALSQGYAQTLSGTVGDSTGERISGATISIPALQVVAETDAQGAFHFANVASGVRLLTVRRIGYAPLSKVVSVQEGDNTLPEIVLRRLAFVLDAVVTEDQLLWREDPLLREMADNMKIGLGQFVLRPALEKLTGLHVSRVFEQQRGLRVVTDGGGHAWIAKRRGISSIKPECVELEERSGSTLPLFAECARDLCWPKVYLDNQPLSIRPNSVPDINRFLPENLEAIEMYTGGAQTPPRYNTLDAQCGVIVLHSRKFIKRPR